MWGRRGNREQGTGNRNGSCRIQAFPFRGRWQPEGLTEEVVLLKEISQTVDTAGGPTSSDPALRPAHLMLAGSLGPTAPLKGKATFGHSAISPTNQNLFFIPQKTHGQEILPMHFFIAVITCCQRPGPLRRYGRRRRSQRWHCHPGGCRRGCRRSPRQPHTGRG